MENGRIAGKLSELASLLEIAGDNPHKIRAYRKASDLIREQVADVAVLSRAGNVTALPGVGKGIGAVLDEIVASGTSTELEAIRERVPASLLEVAQIPGLGPAKVRALWETLGLMDVGEIIQACRENRLVALPGFGKKTQEKVLAGALFVEAGSGLFSLGKARSVGLEVIAWLEAAGLSARLSGPAARGVEVVDGVWVVAGSLADLSGLLGPLGPVTPTADGVNLVIGKMPVRVLSVEATELEVAAVLASSDAAHAAWLVERSGGDAALRARGAKSEAEVYERLGLPVVPVELREGRAPDVPDDLVEAGDLQGCFHVHTDWSDGSGTIEAMVAAAETAGYTWVGISDHSQAASYANGLGPERLRLQRAAIDGVRAKFPQLMILHGAEVDILADGSLDLDDQTLASLDFAVASVHTQLRLDEAAMTARLVKAVSHPLVTLLGHPRGRLLLSRQPSTFDLSAVADAARTHGTALEINASPQRLDLSDADARTAKARGATFAINPDAHAPGEMENQSLGITVARRARLSRGEVLNAGPRKAVLARVAKSRAIPE